MKKYSILIVLLFVIGIYNVKALEIPVNSYVIGEYLFTRDGSDHYNGQLSTDYIMLASKSIGSKNLDDMTIYFKIAPGEYINGATGEESDDDFLERDLAKKIRYYNMMEIPEIKIQMLADINFPSRNGKNYYTFGYDSFYESTDTSTYIGAGMEFYKKNGTLGTGSELMVIHYPDEEGFSELGLTEANTTDFLYDIGSNDVFTIVGYPFIITRSKTGKTKKIYLDFDSQNIISIRNDLVANGTIENGKMKVNVTDSTGKKYKIATALLYFYSHPEIDINENNYLNIYDLVGLYKEIETQVPDLKGMFNANTTKALDYIKKEYNIGSAYEIVDMYSAMTNMPENMSDEIELYDLGNSENRDNTTYHFTIVVYDENGNVYHVPSGRFSGGIGKIVNQPTINSEYISGGNSTDLLQMILLFNSLMSMSE